MSGRWLLPLFKRLNFEPTYLRGDVVLDEAGKLRYPLSHRGWPDDGPILHSVAPPQDLDARHGSGRGIKAQSPHDMLQAFLNASRDDGWAVLSNGIFLRLLRTYHHTFTQGYVQFDLEAICETRNYGDFRALYRMAHASRFVPQGEGREALPPLEQFYTDSLAADQTPLLDWRTPRGARSQTIRNRDLLRAIRALTLIEREGVLQRISYADLGVEELGSIYESLLEA
ncbi:MAG: hypothetical protein U9Q70_13225 [Chloroflexota bacterium]|nr:hypothetical protein [Chloroflexota bacterium]